MSCENLARYSWMTALLSRRKKSCRYLLMNAVRHAYARPEVRVRGYGVVK